MYQLTEVLLLMETLDNNGKTTRCSDTYTEALLWFVCIMWTNNGKTCVSLHTCFVWHFYGSAGIYVVCATWTVAEPNFLYKERVFAVEREEKNQSSLRLRICWERKLKPRLCYMLYDCCKFTSLCYLIKFLVESS